MQVLNWILGFLYCLLLALLVVWVARYLRLNSDVFDWTFRWWAASGILFGVFLLTAISRQLASPVYSSFVLFQVLVVGLLFWSALPLVNMAPEGNFYAFTHILLAVFATILNLRFLARLRGGAKAD